MSKQRKGFLYTIAAAFCAASVYAIGKWVMTNISAVHLVALIFSIASIFMIAWLAISGDWRQYLTCSAKGWLMASLFAGTTAFALMAFWTGIKHLDPTVASFIGRLQLVVAILLGVLLLKERLRPTEIAGGIIVIAGVIVVRFTLNVGLDKWFWIMAVSGISFGFVEVTGKLALNYLDPAPLNTFRNTVVAIIYLLLFAFKKTPFLQLGAQWWGVLLIAFAGPVFARFFFLNALKNIGVSKSSLINQSQPLMVAAIAAVFLGTIPTSREWIGGLIILIGCITMIVGAMKPEHVTGRSGSLSERTPTA